jgi:hypothetical protein
MDLLAIKVNITDFQLTNFTHPKPRRVDQAQEHALLEALRGSKQPAQFLLGEYNRKLPLVLHAWKPDGTIIQIVDPIEKPKRINSVLEESLAHVPVFFHGIQVAMDLIKIKVEWRLFAIQTDLGDASGIAENGARRIAFDRNLLLEFEDMISKPGYFTLSTF